MPQSRLTASNRTTPEPRLAAVAEVVGPYRRVADVGAGDGRLARLLADAGHQVLATEKTRAQRERLAHALPDEPGVEVREGFGLRPLIGESLDAVVMAGMGGGTMARILQDVRPDAAWALVLQPMMNLKPAVGALRRLNRGVSAGRLVASGGRLYPILTAPSGVSWNAAWDPGWDEIGVWFQTDPLWPAWLVVAEHRLERALRRSPPGPDRQRVRRDWLRVRALIPGSRTR